MVSFHVKEVLLAMDCFKLNLKLSVVIKNQSKSHSETILPAELVKQAPPILRELKSKKDRRPGALSLK